MRKLFLVVLVCALISIAPAVAQKGTGGTDMLMSIDALGSTAAVPGPESVPDSFLTLDIGGVENWDLLDDPSNTLLTEALGDGSSMTGIGWDVVLETVGASWLSEARMYFDGSDLDGSGLFLTVGVGNGAPGTMAFSSGGILDLTDVGIPDIPILADGLLYIQFHETFDDVGDAVDSFYQAGSTLDIAGIDGGNWPRPFSVIEVPTASTMGLIALFLGIAALGVYVIRR